MGLLDAKGVGWLASSWSGCIIKDWAILHDQALAMQGARPKALGACTGEAERDNQSAFVSGQDVDANVQPNKLVLHTRNLAWDPDSHPRYE
jgi:hypothetical protein